MTASLMMTAALLVLAQPAAPASLPPPSSVVLTPSTGTMGSRGAGTMPGTATTVLELTLPEITTRKFSRGGVIEVAENTILTKVNLTVAAPESAWIEPQDLLLELHDSDGNRAVMAENVTVVTIDGLKIARFVVTDDADPVVITGKTPLRVRGVIKKKRIVQEWTLQASASPARFISEQAGAHNGERLTIALSQPIARPILYPDSPTITVTLTGQVTPAANLTRLVVAGTAIEPDRTEASQTFSTQVVADASTRELTIEAEDSLGRTASVVIPIAQMGAQKSK